MQQFLRKTSLFLCVTVLLVCIFANADFQQELQFGSYQLTDFKQQDFINRYDMARYLNAARCQDCSVPDEATVEYFDQTWLETHQSDLTYNLDDITLEDTYYRGDNYYYCVAEVVENGYMFGFPRATSPFCRGQFCGDDLARYSEVVESLYRVIRPYVYQNFALNRTDVQERAAENSSDLPVSRQGIISDGVQRCEDTRCVLESPAELDIFSTYCSADLRACSLASYAGFPSGTWPSAPFSILVESDVIPEEDGSDYDIHSFVEPETFLGYVGGAHELIGCESTPDYDGDRVKNPEDTCPYAYNPHQKDLDKDGIGNVCDDDIDGDGDMNPIGIVDDQDRINIALRDQNEDNCLMVVNSDQDNADDDSYGDACDPEEPEAMMALGIDASVRTGTAPLTVDFSESYVGDLDNLQWDFGDGREVEGLSPTHTYQKPGEYVVTAKALFASQHIVIAKLPIEVLPAQTIQVGCQAFADSTAQQVGGEIVFSHEYAGDVAQVVRNFGDEVIWTDPDEAIAYTFTDAGTYRIDMQCYDTAGNRVGLSQLNIEITDDAGRGSYIQASELQPDVGQVVTFSTVTNGFDEADVSEILREYGDGVVQNTSILTTTKSYATPGVQLVRQIISFDDGSPNLENILNLYVLGEPDLPATSLTGVMLTGTVGEVFGFTLTTENIDATMFDYLAWYCEDEVEPTIVEQFQSTFTTTCVYDTPGTKRVKSYLYTVDGEVFVNEMTVYVVGGDLCLDQGYVCDLDGDELPDLCDIDIDGDGEENWLGLLLFEQNDCAIDDENIDEPYLIQYHQAIADGANFDNCPFVSNEDQEDSDEDGYGDLCDVFTGAGPGPGQPGDQGGGDGGAGDGGAGDSDGDGIDDAADACPGIPGSASGCPDGLPDEGDDDRSDNPFVDVENCTACPCPYADYSSALWAGDSIRALLLDEGESVIYRYTAPRIIDEDIAEQVGSN